MKGKGILRIILFGIYLYLLIYLVLFSAEFGRVAVSRSYNLIPFDTISRYIHYRAQFGELNFITNIYGNIIAFAPLGYFLFIFQKKPKFFLGFFVSLFLSISIEVSQFILSVGSLDIDDVILNTLGGSVTYLILFTWYKMGVMINEK